MKLFTIGFTKKNAETFFGFLEQAEVQTLLDVRLNNVSQLAGFAKKDDLSFFLDRLYGIDYVHCPQLAPTKDLLKAYRSDEICWEQYEGRFLELMGKRNIEAEFDKTQLDHGCLLCSEHEPHLCHRRLVAEYFNDTLNISLEVKHLF